MQDAGCRWRCTTAHPAQHRRAHRRDHRKLAVSRRPRRLVGGHCIVDELARRRAGQRARARPRRAPHRPGGARGAVGVQRELGRGDRRAVRRRRRVPAAAEGRRRDRARGERQARGLDAGGQDPAPPGALLRAQAAVDPEPLLPARARRDRGDVRRRCGAASTCGSWCRRRRLPTCRSCSTRRTTTSTRCWPAACASSNTRSAAAPEGDDDRRRLVRGRLEQLRRPLVRDQRRDHRRLPRRRAGAAPGGNLRGRRAPLPRARRRHLAAPRPLAPFAGPALYLFNEVL